LKTREPGKPPLRFVVLIPQSDLLKSFHEYSTKLFAASFAGALSFPIVAPLARVSTPFTGEELKSLAQGIRRLSLDSGGRIQSSAAAPAQICTEDLSFLGVQLNIGQAVLQDKQGNERWFPETARRKLREVFSPPALCAAIVPSHEVPSCVHDLPCAPALSFRSAAVSNFTVRPLPSGEPACSFEWRIGPLVWLPKADSFHYKGVAEIISI